MNSFSVAEALLRFRDAPKSEIRSRDSVTLLETEALPVESREHAAFILHALRNHETFSVSLFTISILFSCFPRTFPFRSCDKRSTVRRGHRDTLMDARKSFDRSIFPLRGHFVVTTCEFTCRTNFASRIDTHIRIIHTAMRSRRTPRRIV